MRIKVTNEQFHLLLANYQIIGDKGLAMVMNGSTLNKIAENKKNDGGKSFKVKIWFGAIPSEIIISTTNSATALTLARKMFPNAKVVSTSGN